MPAPLFASKGYILFFGLSESQPLIQACQKLGFYYRFENQVEELKNVVEKVPQLVGVIAVHKNLSSKETALLEELAEKYHHCWKKYSDWNNDLGPQLENDIF